MIWGAVMAAESLVCLLNSLERATHLAKCLPTATNHHEIATVYASLRDAQQNIHNFLLLQQQQQQNVVAALDENNLLSSNNAVVDDVNGFLRGENVQEMEEGEDQQMPAREEEEVKRLQESIQDVCALQNKRRKRALSPSLVDLYYVKREGDPPRDPVFKPQDRQRKFDLIFQFHG